MKKRDQRLMDEGFAVYVRDGGKPVQACPACPVHGEPTVTVIDRPEPWEPDDEAVIDGMNRRRAEDIVRRGDVAER